MEKPKPQNVLLVLSSKMPLKSKAEIAKKMGENRHNIYSAFRGMAGLELSRKVLVRAKKYVAKDVLEDAKKTALLIS